MPILYSLDFYYTPEESTFGKVVDGCVSAMIEAGCSFSRVLMSAERLEKLVSLGEHVKVGPEDIGRLASAYAGEMMAEGQQQSFSFPPLGRVEFTYDFTIDDSMADDVLREEAGSGSSSRVIGMSFTYNEDPDRGGTIKAALSLWEQYVLRQGGTEADRQNMAKVLEMAECVYTGTGPYFAVMNNEPHLDADRSYDLLMQGALPEGNEVVMVGKALRERLADGALEESGLEWKELPDGGVMIRFSEREGI